MTPKVSIIMGSTSDLKIMEEAAKFFSMKWKFRTKSTRFRHTVCPNW